MKQSSIQINRCYKNLCHSEVFLYTFQENPSRNVNDHDNIQGCCSLTAEPSGFEFDSVCH